MIELIAQRIGQVAGGVLRGRRRGDRDLRLLFLGAQPFTDRAQEGPPRARQHRHRRRRSGPAEVPPRRRGLVSADRAPRAAGPVEERHDLDVFWPRHPDVVPVLASQVERCTPGAVRAPAPSLDREHEAHGRPGRGHVDPVLHPQERLLLETLPGARSVVQSRGLDHRVEVFTSLAIVLADLRLLGPPSAQAQLTRRDDQRGPHVPAPALDAELLAGALGVHQPTASDPHRLLDVTVGDLHGEAPRLQRDLSDESAPREALTPPALGALQGPQHRLPRLLDDRRQLLRDVQRRRQIPEALGVLLRLQRRRVAGQDGAVLEVVVAVDRHGASGGEICGGPSRRGTPQTPARHDSASLLVRRRKECNAPPFDAKRA